MRVNGSPNSYQCKAVPALLFRPLLVPDAKGGGLNKQVTVDCQQPLSIPLLLNENEQQWSPVYVTEALA
jgi:hypothetical protein